MSKKNKNSLRDIRIAVETIVIIFFVMLFLDFGGVFDRILGWLPKFEFWPAVLAANVGVLVLLFTLTMLFGRVYCSFLCPLGILQDGIYAIRTSGAKKNRFKQSYSPAKTIIRYAFLGLFIVAIALGYGAAAYLIEPYSIFGRLVSSFLGKSLAVVLISAATFAIIVILVWKGGRTWCNTVCPVGTILGIFSKWSLARPVIDENKCIGCGLCAKGCKASCIDTENHTVDMSRCVVCFDCIGNCHSDAISYKFGLRPFKAEHKFKSEPAVKAEEAGTDNGRRAFITASALTIGAAALKAQEGHGGLAVLKDRKEPERERKVVPAGAKSIKNFTDHCVGCQLCIDACPNKVLRPSLDPEHFLQPEMNFEKGFCRPECNACSRVCPAGAIKEISIEEKSSISIGHAVYNPDLCVVKTDEVSCGNCARHCPAGAISMVKSEELGGRRIPAVNPERCIGCGHCEYVCPSRPVSAIHVEGNEVHRTL